MNNDLTNAVSPAELPIDEQLDFVNLPERPMLARVADSMFWMSRYVERAEHVARLLSVNANLLTDVGDLARQLQDRQWSAVLRVFHVEKLPDDYEVDRPMGERVVHYLTFNEDEPSSILNCIRKARENARAIRENISAEIYESLNELYWALRGEGRAGYDTAAEAFYDRVATFSMLFQGLCDHTLPRDQRWQFTQLAKWFERVDVTCRVLESRFDTPDAGVMLTDAPLRNIHWMAVLRMCCALEPFRRVLAGELDPLTIAGYLILDTRFPRSIVFGVHSAAEAVREIRLATRRRDADAERILGRLHAHLKFAHVSELIDRGLPAYLADIRDRVNDAAVSLSQAYFLR